MVETPRRPVPESSTAKTGCLPAFLRFFWMALGNIGLFVGALLIARGTAPTAVTAAYAWLVVALVVVRYLDIARFDGRTTENEPATMAHWRRYTVLLVVIAGGLWVLARHAAAHDWL
ncbi:MAG TPA: hypothetical protein PLL30_14890 [Candidatus Krumholzibacteria bacterium]|nr:hypothetical protein [Candidatus Krumholzibacteria bacterium]HPD73055.1 hypothetical protein [Candidatus Krumholzibacteria bacterium]HRY41855.1 hypothetical protein [Candidatus Krumholzibacteria bacterium]